ncbi:uncharacterized protein LOC120536192 isoform X2 [Polypterus senegalus]|uniref:uncharacterized protein LOC120536192 isoform X2 n=1 Tax=Polypterus senegalus TaxID=55291 RepID=UPI0019629C03|nr:uncharacterized protein LOC120536192 isoform X2 [Polypterus senegalus]
MMTSSRVFEEYTMDQQITQDNPESKIRVQLTPVVLPIQKPLQNFVILLGTIEILSGMAINGCGGILTMNPRSYSITLRVAFLSGIQFMISGTLTLLLQWFSSISLLNLIMNSGSLMFAFIGIIVYSLQLSRMLEFDPLVRGTEAYSNSTESTVDNERSAVTRHADIDNKPHEIAILERPLGA